MPVGRAISGTVVDQDEKLKECFPTSLPITIGLGSLAHVKSESPTPKPKGLVGGVYVEEIYRP